MEIKSVEISIPQGYQLIIGQSHFIKTVEDIFETISSAVPGAKFGISFCESSGKALIRYDGTDESCIKTSLEIARKLSAGHCFVIVLKELYPINVLNRIKSVEEVVTLFCATANPVTAIVAETESGRGILGVIDGMASKGVESEDDKRERYQLLRKLGYKR